MASKDQSTIILSRSQEASSIDNDASELPLDRSLSTRNCCAVAMILALIIGIFLLVLGILIAQNPTPYCQIIFRFGGGKDTYCGYKDSGYMTRLPGNRNFYYILPLLINFVLTGLVDGTGFVHSQALKWQLHKEGRLNFNSNLRLFTYSRNSWPNSWYVNALVVAATALTFASPSVMLHGPKQPTKFLSVAGGSIGGYWNVSAVPFITLGASLIVLALVSTSSFVSTSICTWSSHPLEVVLAALRDGSLQRLPGRCMLSVHSAAEDAHASKPSVRQKSAFRASNEVKRVVAYLWAVVAIALVGTLLAMVFLPPIWRAHNDNQVKGSLVYTADDTPGQDAYADSSSLDIVPDGGYWSPLGHAQPTWVLGLGSPGFALSPDSYLAGEAASLVVLTAIQSVLTIALHCIELVSNLSRDESIWRSASTPAGCRITESNSILAALKSWQAISLFICKAVLHWMFGLAIKVADGGLAFFGPQLVYLTGVTFLLAVAVTRISSRAPPGPQPAAYGHLQTLANLVDAWTPTMHWGHKTSEPPHAGTAGHVMPKVDMDLMYS